MLVVLLHGECLCQAVYAGHGIPFESHHVQKWLKRLFLLQSCWIPVKHFVESSASVAYARVHL